MSGKPRELYVDNAAEFKSEALRRGCEPARDQAALPAAGPAAFRRDRRAADRHDDADGPRAAGHDVLQHRRARQLRQRRDGRHDARASCSAGWPWRWPATTARSTRRSAAPRPRSGPRRPRGRDAGDGGQRDRVPGRLPAGDPADADADGIRDRPRAVLQRRAQAVDRAPGAAGPVRPAPRSPRHQPHLGARPRRRRLPRGAVPDPVAAADQRVGAAGRRRPAARARPRRRRRDRPVRDGGADAPDHRRRCGHHPQGPPRPGAPRRDAARPGPAPAVPLPPEPGTPARKPGRSR